MKSVTFKKKTKNLLSLALQSSSLEMMAHEMFCNKQMYPLGTIHIIDPQARREEIEKHRLEKSCKKTSISTSLSSFKMQLQMYTRGKCFIFSDTVPSYLL